MRANGDAVHVLIHLERRNGQRMVSEALRLERFDPQSDRYLTEASRRIATEDENAERRRGQVHPRQFRSRGSPGRGVD
jgi:hypothetical protein